MSAEEVMRSACVVSSQTANMVSMDEEPAAGEQLDAIMRDLDRTTEAWAAAGHGYGTPEDEAREAVFACLKAWNQRYGGTK